MKQKQETTIAIVGLGYWGPNLLRNFSLVEGCFIKYGCDLDRKILERYSSTYPSVKFIKNYNDVLNDDGVDVVVIATPLKTHYSLAKKALSHGKHVLLEKPMAATSNECRELIKIAKRERLILMVDHTFIYTGAVKKIKEFIDAKKLGDIYYFDSERMNLGLIRPDSNVIWDLAPHDIAIMNYLFEGLKPISVFATGTTHINDKFEEMAHIMIKFNNGAVGHVHISWISPLKIRRILIGGSKKMIVYDDVEPSDKIKIYDKGVSFDLKNITPFNPLYRSGDVFTPKIDSSEALAIEAEHFISCVRGKESPQVSGEDGLRIVEILEACDKSLATKKEILL